MRPLAKRLFVFVAFAMVLMRAGNADADVVSKSRVEAALASSREIHSCGDRLPWRDARCVAVGKAGYQGFLFPDSFDYGYLHDGRDLLIVPLQSGGSGGVFVDLLFTSVMTKPYFIGVIPSATGHLGVSIAAGRIVVETPVYRDGDPNCCPSARRFITYDLKRNALRKLNEYEERLKP